MYLFHFSTDKKMTSMDSTDSVETDGATGLPDGIIAVVDFLPRRGHSSSKAWKFYGFPKYADGTISKEKVICKLCKIIKPFKSQMTNMLQHLTRHHWKEVNVSLSSS